MSGCEVKKIDSNVVGAAYAEEKCLGILPDTVADSGLQDGGVWRPLDPNSFGDFGSEVKKTARSPINASRQVRKGVVTGLDASGSFAQDLTQNNLRRLFQGFMFADAHCLPSNEPINDDDNVTIEVVDIEAGSVINVGVGEGASFAVGQLIQLSGFAESANNVVTRISAIAADELTVDASTLVVEAYTVGKLEIVGFSHAAGDLALVYASNKLTLTSTAGFAAMNYQVGQWIFVGGDQALNQFSVTGSSNKPGYARIEKVEANTLTLKEPTWSPLSNTGTGKEVHVYSGDFIRNEKTPSLIKRRSYQIERTLGNDDNGVMSEVLVGAVPNELSLSFSNEDKMGLEMSFVGLDNELRNGSVGLKPGDRTAKLPIEEAFNTADDVYQQRLYIHGDVPTPVSLFAFVTESDLSINNGATGLKAIGTLGSFEVNTGDFLVSGSLNVYFASIEAVQAVRENSDVGFNTILARDNAGMVFDVPLVSLGGGRVNVEKDTPIMLPLDKQAAENENGYTMSISNFAYLPKVAMA